MDKVENTLLKLHGYVSTDYGLAWPASSLPTIFNLVNENNWIILGGEVITKNHKHTWDGWSYNPPWNFPLTKNVANSIEKSTSYINTYIQENGDNFLFILTISDAYVAGIW